MNKKFIGILEEDNEVFDGSMIEWATLRVVDEHEENSNYYSLLEMLDEMYGSDGWEGRVVKITIEDVDYNERP